MNVLQKELWAVMPNARQYGRALLGNTDKSDLLLSQAAARVLKLVPAFRFLASSSIVFPLLLIEFHKQIDSDGQNDSGSNLNEASYFDGVQNELLYEKIDRAMAVLPDLQRRIYLLVTVAKINFSVVSRIVSEPVDSVAENFTQAHLAVLEIIEESEATEHAA